MKDLELSENEVFAFALGEIIIFQRFRTTCKYFREHVLFHCFNLANKSEYEVLYTRFLKFWECDHDWTKLTISETHSHRPFCIILIVLLIEK